VITIDDYPPTMAVEDAAERLGLSRSSGYRAVGRGEIPTLRSGRRIVVPTHLLFSMFGIEPRPSSATSQGV
jgi:excisionase family DNA binding protein